MAPLLEINDLRTEIRLKQGVVHAVDGVSMHVDAGETLGIVGESGCGKTMTALSIMKLLPNGGSIVGGSITLEGQQISTLADDDMRRIRGNDIGMIFQDPLTSLNPTMTVGKQIAEAVKLHRGASNEQAMDRAAEVLNLVGLPQARERISEYPHQFSGGMRQRVMIAMALAADPEVVIMDEPTTALDVVVQRDILAQIVELKETLGFAVLFITHDLSLLLELADRIAVMYAGRLLETGAASAIMREPAHPYTRGLLHSFPSLHGPRRELVGIPGTPPDLRGEQSGCPFIPRCSYAIPACAEVDMSLGPVTELTGPGLDRRLPISAGSHLTACPIVTPEVSQEGVLS